MRTTILPFVILLAACATSPNQPAGSAREQTVRVVGASGATQISTTVTARPSVATLDMPLDQVWRALSGAYASVGIEIALTDPARGVLGNPGFRARRRLGDAPISRYLDCGRAQGAPSADTYEVHFSVLSEVQQESPDHTIVTTNVDATAKPVNYPGESVRCSSKGELETRILQAVREAGPQ